MLIDINAPATLWIMLHCMNDSGLKIESRVRLGPHWKSLAKA